MALSLLDLLPTLLRTVPAVQQGMKGVNLGPSAETTNEINQLAKAQTNMNNPLFQSLLAQNKQAGNQQLSNTISQLQAQNRLAMANGRNPLLSQERGGESIFRNLVQGQQDVGNQAIGNTFNQLENGTRALTGSLNAQNQLANNQYGNTQKQTAAYGTIGDALQGLFGLGNKQGQSSSGNSMNYLMPQQNYNYNNSSYTNPLQQTGQQLLPQNFGFVSNG